MDSDFIKFLIGVYIFGTVLGMALYLFQVSGTGLETTKLLFDAISHGLLWPARLIQALS